jgi:ElaB/YqjD/DUF883 family membrane-anchored ribosome-binding protein
MYDNGTSKNGGEGASTATPNTRARAEEARDHLRAAKDAAAEAVRGSAAQAKDWTRTQYPGLQERVEAEPYRAAAWALGIGFVAGVLITALARSGRR